MKLVGNAEVLALIAGLINKEVEPECLNREIEKYQGEIQRIENKLANDAFVAKAPPAVIDKERAKMAEYAEGLDKLKQQYQAIEEL